MGNRTHKRRWWKRDTNPDKLRCPNCRSVRLARDGKIRGIQRYHCLNCDVHTILPLGGKKK